MMNLDLATFGVEEMNETELQNVDGGLFPLLLIVVVGGIILGTTSCDTKVEVNVNVGAGTGNKVNTQVGDSIGNKQ